MSRIRGLFADYFSFNRSEQRGISVLLVLLLAMVAGNRLIPVRLHPDQGNITSVRIEIRAFEEEMRRAEEQREAGRKQRPRQNYPLFSRGDTSSGRKTRQPVTFFVELNSADTMELQRLRGIGPAFARRIIGYRERLGGFTSPDQLKEVYGMDPERYSGILRNLAVDTLNIQKIDINAITFKELMRHPYFPYELTREIMLYRKKIKRFQGMEDLNQVIGMNDSILSRIRPYISF